MAAAGPGTPSTAATRLAAPCAPLLLFLLLFGYLRAFRLADSLASHFFLALGLSLAAFAAFRFWPMTAPLTSCQSIDCL